MWSLNKPAGFIIGLAFVVTFLSDVRCDSKCAEQIGWLPRNKEYRSHCDSEGAEPKWTCFATPAYNIQSTWATTPSNLIKDVDFFATDLFLIKDGDMHYFTTRDPSAEFTLEFRDKGFKVTYSQYDESKGCYKLAVEKVHQSDMELGLLNESFDTIAATFGNHPLEGEACTKWVNLEFYHRDGIGKWATVSRIT
ncbi:uncharacterized protein UTRI_03999 [Ustilago trichophora]|uniref:Mig1 protein, induced during biotrophic phase n=1 Tax=Ustilago trichophora TaxID=86804 RepID=A0A5C3E8G2_9BASI|nr:uncharacterized protein UTRI_03999 [Ustilago trichophora]